MERVDYKSAKTDREMKTSRGLKISGRFFFATDYRERRAITTSPTTNTTTAKLDESKSVGGIDGDASAEVGMAVGALTG